jgi:hypothetical protein
LYTVRSSKCWCSFAWKNPGLGMGIFGKQPRAAAPEEGGPAAGPRGEYAVDEHKMSPQEVAAKYETVINWENIGASQGLTSAQVGVLYCHAAAAKTLYEYHGMAAGEGWALLAPTSPLGS